MKVLIAEKPSVAKEIAGVLGAKTRKDGYLEGGGYQVTWAYGHLIGLVDPRGYGYTEWIRDTLPMIPEEFRLTPISKDVEKQLAVIRELFKGAERIVVATDAGREGELIFRYIYKYLDERYGIHPPFDRLWISSLTEKGIREGFNQLRLGSDYDNVYAAAKARSEADWLVGMNATRATTLSIGKQSGVWSIGRVQTPTLAMICKRFIENRDFKPVPYFTLQVLVEQTSRFAANHAKRFEKREEAVTTLEKVREAGEMRVLKTEGKDEWQMPPLLYDLTSLQKDANSRHGFTADKTLEIAQSLYEKKLTTYPRTGSRYIPDDVFELLPGLIRNVTALPTGIDALKPLIQAADGLRGAILGRGSVNAAKVTDHHALLPTETVPSRETLSQLTREEMVIYVMIVGRMLESVSRPCVKFVTTVTLESPSAPGVPFVAKGFVIKEAGWRGVLGIKEEKKEDEFGGQLPKVTEGDLLRQIDGYVVSKFTKAPPLLTENSLLGMMEVAGKELEDEEMRESMKDVGIGTPATRASIIETLITRGYVVREKKSLVPTEKGLALYEVIKDMRISNVEVTGDWEAKLNRICEGRMDVGVFNEEIIGYTREITRELLESKIDTSKVRLPGTSNCPCPKCKKEKLKFSKKGYLYCPDMSCGFCIPMNVLGKKIDERTALELASKGKTKVIKGLKSQAGKVFNAALILKEDFKVGLDLPDNGPTEGFEGSCPKCGSTDLKRNKARVWCAAEGCDFKLWRKVSGKELTDEEIGLLIRDRAIGPFTFHSAKKGTNFEAKLVLDDTLDVKLVFEDRGKPYPIPCPKCGKETLLDYGKVIKCREEGCDFGVWREVSSHTLSEEEMTALLREGSTGLLKFHSAKKGTDFEARLKLDEDHKAVFEFPERKDNDKPYPASCPGCGKESLFEFPKGIKCRTEGCGFVLWKEYGGHVLTEKETKELLTHRRTSGIVKVKTKEGKPAEGHLKIGDGLKLMMEYKKKK